MVHMKEDPLMRNLVDDILKRRKSKNKETVTPKKTFTPEKKPPVRRPEPQMVSDPQEGISDAALKAIADKIKPAIKIVGCGGAGCNTINRCNEEITNVDMYALNTDAAHLYKIKSPNKLLIGEHVTRGLGAGAKPQIGERAAQEVEHKINELLMDAKMVFITCGMGGGTGTGSAPYVAKLARDMGKAMTLAIVTYPFEAEGLARRQNALWGINKLKSVANTVIVIKNDKLLELVPRLPLDSAFRVADEILMRSIKSLTAIITEPGLINLDYNDVAKVIVDGGGLAMIGMGKSDGDDRVTEAVDEAINSPLLDMDISNARSCLINVVGGPGMTVEEANGAAEMVQQKIDPNAEVILGARIDPTLEGALEIMIVLTGVVSKDIDKAQMNDPFGASNIPYIE